MSPQLRYSIFYFCINLSSGVTVAFFPLHCKHLAFSPMEIALASAAANLATLFGAPGFTSLSYHRFSPRRILFVCSFLACLFYVPLLLLTDFLSVMIFWIAYLFLNSATTVTVDARAVRESLAGEIRFEHARLWGSIGFMLSLALVGWLIDLFGMESIIYSGLCFVVVTHLASYLVFSRIPAQRGFDLHTPSETVSGGSIRGPFLTVLAAVGLVWASHAVYYVYFSIYLKALGWSGVGISVAWNLGVIAEILLFIAFPRICTGLSLPLILKLSAALTVLRWIVLANTANPIVLVGIQALHAFSFGALYLSSIHLVQKISPPEFRERAQGLLSGFSSGAGSLGGRLLFGYLATGIAASTELYLLFWPAALVALLGFFVSLFLRSPSTDSR